MTRKLKVINVVLFALLCLSMLTNISQAVTPEEIRKIEAAVPAKATVTPKRPRKLLVFNLCEGYVHTSIPYAAKALEIMGKKTGAFEVVQSTDMASFEPENLRQFDAVCFNNTSRLKFAEPALRRSLMDFVRSGKGVVGIHAATDNFYNWPEAAEMMGGLFDRHPWRHNERCAIKIDEPDHPLNAAFKGKSFKLTEEIYQFKQPYSRYNLRVLLSLDMTSELNLNRKDVKRTDNDFAVSWVRKWGKGRVFYCSLGHNHHIFWNPAILQHYLDGIQFALGDLDVDAMPSALGLEHLEEMLKAIAAYEYGASRQPLTEITDFTRSAHDYPELLEQIEEHFLEFLRSASTVDSKEFICRQLSLIGTERAVPALSARLTEPATSEMACYALERIPSPAVDKALRGALARTGGKVRIGIINCLGQRHSSEAVETLGEIIYDSDLMAAEAAAAALGKIGGTGAADILNRALLKAKPQLQPALTEAYLLCADRFLAEGKTKSAKAIYKKMYKKDQPRQTRIAALTGLVMAEGEKADRIIVDVLKGDEPVMQSVVIGLVRQVPGTRTTKAVAKQLPKLSAPAQLLAALGDRGDAAALPAVLKAVKATDQSVRVAALKALGRLGNASTVKLLAQTVALAKAPERRAARNSLDNLRGPKVDETILAALPLVKPEIKVQLIRSIGQRNIGTAAAALLKTAQSPDRKVRFESIKVLRDIAGPEHLSALVNLLIKAESQGERKETEGTVVVVAGKIADPNQRIAPILSALPSVTDINVRCSLLSVLGKIGGAGALGVLRQVLENDNSQVQLTAVRVLSNWPGPEPIADLLETAKTSDDAKLRVLALYGYVRLIGLDSDRPADETIKMYKQAMDLTSSADVKKKILSGLTNINASAALQMAADCLEDEALRQEAELAVVKIAEATLRSELQSIKTVLQEMLQVSKNDSLRKRAREMIDWISELEKKAEGPPAEASQKVTEQKK